MSLLSDLQTIVESCGVSVETGVFSGKAPDTYLVITPLSDSFELHADNTPGCISRKKMCSPHRSTMRSSSPCSRR